MSFRDFFKKGEKDYYKPNKEDKADDEKAIRIAYKSGNMVKINFDSNIQNLELKSGIKKSLQPVQVLQIRNDGELIKKNYYIDPHYLNDKNGDLKNGTYEYYKGLSNTNVSDFFTDIGLPSLDSDYIGDLQVDKKTSKNIRVFDDKFRQEYDAQEKTRKENKKEENDIRLGLKGLTNDLPYTGPNHEDKREDKEEDRDNYI